MEIMVNGEKKTFQSALTVSGLLDALSINPNAVVVERNLKILDRGHLARESVQDGDRIEIIRMVGGG